MPRVMRKGPRGYRRPVVKITPQIALANLSESAELTSDVILEALDELLNQKDVADNTQLLTATYKDLNQELKDVSSGLNTLLQSIPPKIKDAYSETITYFSITNVNIILTTLTTAINNIGKGKDVEKNAKPVIEILQSAREHLLKLQEMLR